MFARIDVLITILTSSQLLWNIHALLFILLLSSQSAFSVGYHQFTWCSPPKSPLQQGMQKSFTGDLWVMLKDGGDKDI